MPENILIIDDSHAIRKQVADIFSHTFPDCFCLQAGDGISGLKMALGNRLDLILCDLEMPGLDGFKFLAMKNSRHELRDVPLIILTGHETAKVKVKGFEQGASDYITKPFDTGEFLARINVHIKIKRLQDELRRKNRQLEELSNTDSLTGLFNRRYLMQTLQSELDRTRRHNHPMSLLMIDIDHFKQVNDRYGHQKGDEVLAQVAHCLKEGLRGYDLVARYGGEEFCMVLPETEQEGGLAMAERLRRSIKGLTFEAAGKTFSVSASFGLACYPASSKGGIDDLMRLADEALYQAKSAGRDRVEAR